MIMPILNVTDVDASLAFYKDKLGFNTSFTMPGPDGKTAFAVINLGQAVTMGLQLDDKIVTRGDGIIFMVYVPDETDIDKFYGDVQGRGITITEPIQDGYWGDRYFSVKDPDGYFLSLAKTVKQMSNEEIASAAQAR